MYLDEILAHKRAEIASLPPVPPCRPRPIIDACAALRQRPVIAEVKKASPSLGDINRGADVYAMARRYEEAGAGAISVLTDEKYFKGSFAFLSGIAARSSIPVLCKDFIVSERQLYLAHGCGADLILLIAAALDAEELSTLAGTARGLGMEILFEIHDPGEFDKIAPLSPALVGINARDLRSFSIDRERALDSMRSLSGSFIKVAESGINTTEDILAYRSAGADAYLIGTALMTADDPAAKICDFTRAAGGTCS